MAKMSPEKAVRTHEKRMHPGKTPSFKKGGPTTDDRMKYGKNLSRAMNQKTG